MAGVLVERVREEIGRLPAPLRRLLARHGFDLGEFLDLVRRWETGKLGPEASRVSSRSRKRGSPCSTLRVPRSTSVAARPAWR
jgi:hypothetical protein